MRITDTFQTPCIIFLQLIVVGLLVFSACDGSDVTGTNDAEGHGVVEVTFGEDSITLNVGDQQELSVVLLNAEGEIVDPADLEGYEIEWDWWSTNTDVFTVVQEGRNGTVTAHDEGEEYCIVEVTILEGNSNFTGRDSLRVLLF